jgi:hypothetical protein
MSARLPAGLADSVIDDCRANERLGRLIARNKELEAESTRLAAERDEARRRQDETQQHIQDLLNSRSWKIAAPYRSLGVLVRRSRAAIRHRFGSDTSSIVEDQPATLDGFVRRHSQLLLVNAVSRFDAESDDAALALATAGTKAGYGVILIGWQQSEADAFPGRYALIQPNLFQIGRFDMKELVAVLRHAKPASATLLVTVPSLEIVQPLLSLEAAGVRVIYHKLRDWAAISKRGEAAWYEERLEKHLMLNADRVTYVAPAEPAPIISALPIMVPASASWADQLEMILQ